MTRTPASLSLAVVAVSAAAAALLLAALVAADGQKQQGYVQPAYRRPAAGLKSDYYHQSCPDMEGIVQRAVKKAIAADSTLAPALLRLFFHDFAVGVRTPRTTSPSPCLAWHISTINPAMAM